MSELLKNIIRFVLVTLVQVFILFKMPPLHRFIPPISIFSLSSGCPFGPSRAALTLSGLLFCASAWIILPKTSRSPCRGLHPHRFMPSLLSSDCLSRRKALTRTISRHRYVSMGWAPMRLYVIVLDSFTSYFHLVLLEWMLWVPLCTSLVK